jgi:hypothetical protein
MNPEHPSATARRTSKQVTLPCWADMQTTSWHQMELTAGCAHCEIEQLRNTLEDSMMETTRLRSAIAYKFGLWRGDICADDNELIDAINKLSGTVETANTDSAEVRRFRPWPHTEDYVLASDYERLRVERDQWKSRADAAAPPEGGDECDRCP